MIALGIDAAILVIGVFVLVAVGWGANLSVRSAAAGPRWAMGHLDGLRRLWPSLLIAGAAIALLVRPFWVGAAAVYIVAVMWFLSAMLLRNLHRLEALDGFVEIDPERRVAILRRSRRFLFAGGLVLALLGGLSFSAGPVAWVTLALGAVLVGTAARLTGTQEAGA